MPTLGSEDRRWTILRAGAFSVIRQSTFRRSASLHSARSDLSGSLVSLLRGRQPFVRDRKHRKRTERRRALSTQGGARGFFRTSTETTDGTHHGF